MDRRNFLRGTLAGGALSGLGSNVFGEGTRRKPNVVICFLDQMRAFEVGCYGNSVIRTPNMDRLAATGCRFDVGVVNNPVCVPTRSSLLTGQYSRTCMGQLGNQDVDPAPYDERTRLLDPTLPEILKGAGYQTAVIGKWHLHPHPFLMGFDYALYPEGTQERYYDRTYLENWRTEKSLSADGKRKITRDYRPTHVNEFVFDYLTSKMQQYISQAKDDPFFLYYNITLPHMPLGPGNMPDKYVKMYDRNQVPLRKNVFKDGVMAYDEMWFKIYTIWDYPLRIWPKRLPDRETDKLPEGFDLRDVTAYYYGATTCADDLVGELMKSLEDNGIADDTIVILSADHGDNLGSHHKFNKSLLIEESMRVPMIFRYPKALKPSVNKKQVASTIDIMPTALELCGIPAGPHIQGQSLVPVMRKERESLEKDSSMIETSGFDIGVRTPSHMYGMKLAKDKHTITDDRLYFFDLQNDPFEVNNLAKTGEESDLAAQLRRRLTTWNKTTPWLEV